MTVATLLHGQDPWYNFDHYRDHVNMLLKEGGTGSLNFSGIPYWIDPPFNDTTVPAGWMNSLHTHAHKDFNSLFPAPNGGSELVGLNDVTEASDSQQWSWFSNLQLHYIANHLP